MPHYNNKFIKIIDCIGYLPSVYFTFKNNHFKKRIRAKLFKSCFNIDLNFPIFSATPNIALNELVIAKNVDSNIIVTDENV
jgi:hypothetical protein